MRNSEFIKRLKGHFALCAQHSALRIPHFSVGQQKILFLLALLILAILYFKFHYHPSSPPEEIYQEVVVEVLGEVYKSGIYIFRNPPTLEEAIEKAGGLREPALFDKGRSSEFLETGTLISVQKESQEIPSSPPFTKIPSSSPFPKGGSRGIREDVIKIKLGRMEARKLFVFNIPLDLNRVSAEDLCLVSGIGESLAREIVTYRERRRGFRSVKELINVKGVEEKKYQSLKTFFTVRP